MLRRRENDSAQEPVGKLMNEYTYRELKTLSKLYLLPMTISFFCCRAELADGKVDQKIVSKSNDEIGQLADVLERLRISLKAAMDRLSRK